MIFKIGDKVKLLCIHYIDNTVNLEVTEQYKGDVGVINDICLFGMYPYIIKFKNFGVHSIREDEICKIEEQLLFKFMYE